MPASLSKPAESGKQLDVKKEEASRKKQASQLLLLNVHMACNVALSLFVFNVRTDVARKLVLNDEVALTNLLSRWAATIGLLEFAVNPTIGKLSDAYGRKPFMLAAPAASFFLKALAALNPTIFTLTLEKIICDSLRTMSGTTICNAAISDICSQEQLGQALATFQSWAGCGVILGPFIAARIVEATGSNSAAFLLASAASGALLAVEARYMDEPLPKASRRPFPGFSSPLSLHRLFTEGSSKLTTLNSVLGLQYLVESKNMTDIAQLFQMNVLGWGQSSMANFTSSIGIGMFLNGPLFSVSLNHFGDFGHTTVTNLVSAASFAMRGCVHSTWAMWASTVLMFWGDQRLNSAKSMATNIAIANGMGKGEFAGLLANLRAACVFIAPLLYGWLYNTGNRIGQPGLPFIGMALICLVAEAVHQTVDRK